MSQKISEAMDNVDENGNHIGLRNKLLAQLVSVRKEIDKLEGGYFADGLITHTLY